MVKTPGHRARQDNSQPSDPPRATPRRGRSSWVRVLIVLSLTIILAGGLAAGTVWLQERPLREVELALDRNDISSALQLTADFLRDRPDHGRCLALRARALVAAGSPGEAIELFDRVGPASSEDLHALAHAYLMEQQWTRALPLLLRLLQLEPNNADALYEITACRVRLGMLREALSTAERFAALPGHEARGFVFLGTIHSDLGNHAEAAAAYEQVRKHSTELQDLQVSREDFLLEQGRTLLSAGRPAEAVAPLQDCLAETKSAEGFLLLGNACHQLGQEARADQAWREALDLENAHVPAREALANASLQQGNPRDALDWLAPLVAHPQLPASTAYLFQRAHTLAGNSSAADRWAQRVAQARAAEKRSSAINTLLLEAPQSFWAQVVRAHRFAAAGNWGQAEAILQGLQRENPSDPFFVELVESVGRRGPLPSLDTLPIQQF